MANAWPGTLSASPEPRDEPRIARLLAQHHAFVWRLLRRLGVQQGRVDDEVQRVFLIAAARLSEVKQEAERSFLVGTAVRVAANARRSQASVKEDLRADALADIATSAPTPEDLVDRKRRRELLDRILAQLSFEQRTVFVLSELEEMSRVEIAQHLRLPKGTVASRLRLAKRHFYRLVARAHAQLHTTASRNEP